MTAPPPASVLGKLAALQTELVDQAYGLERQGRVDAADMAIMTAARLGELYTELEREGAGADRRSATSAPRSSVR